jgi:hypothetical protein
MLLYPLSKGTPIISLDRNIPGIPEIVRIGGLGITIPAARGEAGRGG